MDLPYIPAENSPTRQQMQPGGVQAPVIQQVRPITQVGQAALLSSRSSSLYSYSSTPSWSGTAQPASLELGWWWWWGWRDTLGDYGVVFT